MDHKYRPIDSEAAYQNILKGITKKKPIMHTFFRTSYGYAAAILLFICLGIGLYSTNKAVTSSNQKPIVEVSPPAQITLELEDGTLQVLNETNKAAITNKKGKLVVHQEYDKLKYVDKGNLNGPLVYNQLAIPYGKRFEIELSDGTIVYLNAGTKLRYPRAFTNPNSREVFLEGEALFKVKENKTQPFIVHTDKMNIQVLGTTFNVSSYKNENNTSTVLVEGSVSVYDSSLTYNSENSTVITPSQQASFTDEGFIVNKVNVQKHIAWTQGKLFFVNNRFEDIIKELERFYNIKIINNSAKLNNVRYTGTFESETISEVLNTFKKNTQFEYQIENNILIIKPSHALE